MAWSNAPRLLSGSAGAALGLDIHDEPHVAITEPAPSPTEVVPTVVARPRRPCAQVIALVSRVVGRASRQRGMRLLNLR